MFGSALFPRLVTSSLEPANRLTLENAASSRKTLKIMAAIAVVGMPVVLAYSVGAYWTFHGKVKLDQRSY
jgi:cytochrome d ubiquinol oxidase subunit II